MNKHTFYPLPNAYQLPNLHLLVSYNNNNHLILRLNIFILFLEKRNTFFLIALCVYNIHDRGEVYREGVYEFHIEMIN